MPDSNQVQFGPILQDSLLVKEALSWRYSGSWDLQYHVPERPRTQAPMPYSTSELPGLVWWFFLVVWLGFMALVRWFRREEFTLFTKGMFQNGALRKFQEVSSRGWRPPFLLLFLLSISTPWLYVLYVTDLSLNESWPWYVLGAWLVLPLFKSWFIGLVGRLFGWKDWAALHQTVTYQSHFVFGTWFAVALLPVMVGRSDFLQPWYMGLFGIVLTVMYQIFRLFVLWRVPTFISLIYFLLYLCTLELLPLMWIIKINMLWV